MKKILLTSFLVSCFAFIVSGAYASITPRQLQINTTRWQFSGPEHDTPEDDTAVYFYDGYSHGIFANAVDVHGWNSGWNYWYFTWGFYGEQVYYFGNGAPSVQTIPGGAGSLPFLSTTIASFETLPSTGIDSGGRDWGFDGTLKGFLTDGKFAYDDAGVKQDVSAILVPANLKLLAKTLFTTTGGGGISGVDLYWYIVPTGTPSVSANVAVNDPHSGLGAWNNTQVTVFPRIDISTSPNRYAYLGQPLKIQIAADDPSTGIQWVGYKFPGHSWISVASSAPSGSLTEVFDGLPVSDPTFVVGAANIGGIFPIESAPVSVNVLRLELAPPMEPAFPQLATWPAAPTGAPDKAWDIVADYHHLNGARTSTVDYGLEFEEHQYLQQRWQWVDPVTGVLPASVPPAYQQPQETITEPDAPVLFWNQGPVHQSELKRWTPGARPVPPVATFANLEINAGDSLPASIVTPNWGNPWSMAQRPDSWPEWPDYTNAHMRRNTAIDAPAGETTVKLVRAQDGYTWSGPITTATALPAGTWNVTVSYEPANGEFYLSTTQNLIVTVRPALVVKATHAKVEYSIDGGQIWNPWPAGATAWQKPSTFTLSGYFNPWIVSEGGVETVVPEIRLRAKADPDYAWGTEWVDPDTGPVWYNSRSTGLLDTDSNFSNMAPTLGQFNAPVSIPQAINATTMEAIGMQIPPRMTHITINDVPDFNNPGDKRKARSSTVGEVSPWVYLARPGVEFRVQGQSRESGVNGFEAYILPPNLDPNVEGNWQKLDTTLVLTPPKPNTTLPTRPMQLADQTYSVQIGKTKAQMGETGPGAAFIPSSGVIGLAGMPNDVFNTNIWQFRVRCRSTVSTWSAWQTYQVYAVLPLRSELITTQTMAPAAPLGAEQWFRSSTEGSEIVYVWLP